MGTTLLIKGSQALVGCSYCVWQSITFSFVLHFICITEMCFLDSHLCLVAECSSVVGDAIMEKVTRIIMFRHVSCNGFLMALSLNSKKRAGTVGPTVGGG